MGESAFSGAIRGLIDRCRGVGCSLCVVRRAACLVVGPVIDGGSASLFGSAAAVRASGWMTASS